MMESNITDYTVYAIGAPIVLALIAIEAIFPQETPLAYTKQVIHGVRSASL